MLILNCEQVKIDRWKVSSVTWFKHYLIDQFPTSKCILYQGILQYATPTWQNKDMNIIISTMWSIIANERTVLYVWHNVIIEISNS